MLETIPLAGIARTTGVSDSWLQVHVHTCYAAVPKTLEVVPKPKSKLRVQMDELWSFVVHKGVKQWVWLALDTDTREIIIGAIWNFIHEYNQLVRKKMADREEHGFSSVLY